MQLDIKSSFLSHFVDINLFLFHTSIHSVNILFRFIRDEHHDGI